MSRGEFIKKMESVIITQAHSLHILSNKKQSKRCGPAQSKNKNKNSPLRNIPPNDNLSYRSSLKHRTGMAPHHSTKSCDQETTWLTNKGSDSRSNR